jgi:hypothetical protein
MSIGNLLTKPSIDSLLALGTLDVLVVLASVVACAAALAAVLFYVTREPVYISATPSQPFWRRRSTQGVCACCVTAIVIFAIL